MFGELAKKLKNELSYLQKVAAQKQEQVKVATGRVTNAIVQPLRTNTVKFTAELQRNLRAEAALRSNQRQTAKPVVVHPDGGTTRKIQSGGIASSAERITDPNTRQTTHAVAFERANTVNRHDAFTPPQRNLSGNAAAVRTANIKYQLGQLLSEVKAGDTVTSTPITSDNGKNPRAAIYDRATKGALKSKVENFGTASEPYYLAEMESKRGSHNMWKNIVGENKRFNPETLKTALEELAKGQLKGKAVRAVVQHPAAQALIMLDDVVGAATGERVSERVGRGHKDTITKSIQERLKKERFFNPQQLPF